MEPTRTNLKVKNEIRLLFHLSAKLEHALQVLIVPKRVLSSPSPTDCLLTSMAAWLEGDSLTSWLLVKNLYASTLFCQNDTKLSAIKL